MEAYKYALYGNRQSTMKKYVLQKDTLGLKKGTVFVHDTEDSLVGSFAEGCLKLAWTDDGMCQIGAPCGGTYILHASIRNDPEWFKEDVPVKELIKKQLIEFINKL